MPELHKDKTRKVGRPPDPPEDPPSSPPVKMLSRRQMLAKVGPVSYPTIWKMMNEGTFPRARLFGKRTVWFEHELDAYLANLPLRPLKVDRAA